MTLEQALTELREYPTIMGIFHESAMHDDGVVCPFYQLNENGNVKSMILEANKNVREMELPFIGGIPLEYLFDDKWNTVTIETKFIFGKAVSR